MTSEWRALDGRQRHIMVGALAANSLLFFDQTATIVALPSISDDLGLSGGTTGAVAWIVTSFLLALAVIMPVAGRVADRYGRKATLLTGLGLFGLGSALCAIAPNLPLLIAFRFLQGAGGAMVQPLILEAATRAVGAGRRGWAIGTLAMGGTTFLILGPLIAAGLLQTGSWRLIFVATLPVLAFASYELARFVPHTADRGDDLELGAIGWLIAGLSATVVGISQLSEWGWAAAGLIGIGIALISWFLRRETRSARPLIPVRYLSDPLLGSCLIALGAIQFAVLAVMISLVAFLELGIGATTAVAGVVVAIAGMGSALFSPTTGKMADQHGSRPLVLVGLALTMAGLAWMTGTAGRLDVWWLLPGILLFSFARPAVFTPASIGPFATLPERNRAFAASLVTEARQLGAVLGVAVPTEVAQLAGGARDPLLAFVVATAVTLAVCATAWLVIARRMPSRAALEST